MFLPSTPPRHPPPTLLPYTTLFRSNPVNDRPTTSASPSSLNLNEDGSTTVAVSGADVETGAAGLSFTLTHGTAHGTPTLSTPTLTDADSFSSSPQTLGYSPDAT